MKLNSRSKVPPGLFRFRHPISGAEESFHHWGLLRDWVTNHTTGNNYPAVSDEEIEQQMCEGFGEKIAKQYCSGDGVTVAGVDLHWRDILRGTKLLAGFLLAGSPLVSKDEAERRAAICRTCSRNVNFAKPCGGLCGELADAVKSIVGAAGTSVDSDLNACAVCKCSLVSKVHLPMDMLKASDTPEIQAEYPPKCWLKNGNEV